MAIAKLAATPPGRGTKGPPCSVCNALATIPPDEADGLRSMLADPRRRFTEISRMIADDPDTPLQIDGNVLARHARGGCAAREKLR